MPGRHLFGLIGNHAATDPGHSDIRLRGRRYAIPFDRVWKAAIEVVERERPRWDVVSIDDREGMIQAEASTRLFGFVDDIRILVHLDADAQTRVDAESASRVGLTDLGTNARRIRRFFRDLDRELDARPRDILPPRRAEASADRAGA